MLTLPDAQIVFVDTPGIHKADTPLNKRLMDTVRNSLEERDLLLFAGRRRAPFGEQDRRALDLAGKTGTPVVLVLNKIDLVKDKAQPAAADRGVPAPLRISPITCRFPRRETNGLDELRKVILAHLPEGPAYFPEDYVTDQPERFLAAELVREKILLATRQEVPHSVAVMVDSWEETPSLTRIFATIRVERRRAESHRHRQQGRHAEEDRHAGAPGNGTLFGVKIYLDLHVRVQPGWREKPPSSIPWTGVQWPIEDD